MSCKAGGGNTQLQGGEKKTLKKNNAQKMEKHPREGDDKLLVLFSSGMLQCTSLSAGAVEHRSNPDWRDRPRHLTLKT